jgi:hypothetical protein
VLGPALERLHQWAYGDQARGAIDKPVYDKHGRPVMIPPNFVSKTPGREMPLTQRDEAAQQRVTEQVKSIREGLEAQLKAHPDLTEDDAIKYASDRAARYGWRPPGEPSADATRGGVLSSTSDPPSKGSSLSLDDEGRGDSVNSEEPTDRRVGRALSDVSGTGQPIWGGRFIQTAADGTKTKTKTIQIEEEYNAETKWETKLELRDIILRMAAPKGQPLPRAISNLQYWFNNDPKRPDVLEIPFAEIRTGASYAAAEKRLFEHFKISKGEKVPKELVGLTLMDWAKAQPNFKPGDTITLPDTNFAVPVQTGVGASPKAKEEKLFFSMGAFMVDGKGSGFTATKARDGSITIKGTVTLSARDPYNWNHREDAAQIPVRESDLNMYKPNDVTFTGFGSMGFVFVKDGFFKDLAAKNYGSDFKIITKDNPTFKIEFDERLPGVNFQPAAPSADNSLKKK